MADFSFDPLKKFHKRVRDGIGNNIPGLAQSRIGGETVSVVVKKHVAKIYGGTSQDRQILSRIILNLAKKNKYTLASDNTFARVRIEFMIKDRKLYPKQFKKKHAEANALKILLNKRPNLFY